MGALRYARAWQVLAVGGCTVAAAAALVASAGGGPLSRHSNATTFTDPSGDAAGGAAPDMTTVAVANDDEGTLTFRVVVPNRSSWAPEDFVGIFMDTDGNPGTGCPSGSDYTIVFLGRAATTENFFVLLHCTNGVYDTGTLQGSFIGSLDLAGTALSFSVNRRDIGSPERITFSLVASGQGGNEPNDYAPDIGLGDWTYDVLAPSLPTYRDIFGKTGAAKGHSAPIPQKARAVQVLVRWQNPVDTFDVSGVQVIDGNRTVSPARIARVRRPDKLCSFSGCQTRRGTSLLVDVAGLPPAPRTTSGLDSTGLEGEAERRRIRFTVRGKKVTGRTQVRTEVVAKTRSKRG